MEYKEHFGDVPIPRFGHTCTYIGDDRMVLFGGAQGDGGKYVITADTFILDCSKYEWSRLPDTDAQPSPRAAHCAACIDKSQLVIYGGATGGGSLSSDSLYLLDYRNESNPNWLEVPVNGPTPGKRYGHSMSYTKPLLITFAGNNGQHALNDIWFLNVDASPFQWQKVQIKEGSREPRARVYHAADVCIEGPAHGMMCIFGGRTDNNSGLKDIWGLRQHRDGRWDWVEAPTKSGPAPEERFQHTCLFWGSKFLVIGGRKASTRASEGVLPTSVYDTETCTWSNIPSAERFRHHSWLKTDAGQSELWVCGGFDHNQVPTNTLRYVLLDRVNYQNPEEMETDRFDYNPQATAMQQQEQQVQDRRISLGVGGGNDLVRISDMVHVVQDDGHQGGIQQINLNALAEESRKVGGGMIGAGGQPGQPSGTPVHELVIRELLRPHDWVPPENQQFFLSPQEIYQLLSDVRQIFEKESMLLDLTVPIKIFGDIHGQFHDLMRLFQRYKAPNDSEDGDIDSLSYLFLGDYVDRGGYSLEVIVLLFALKVKYPGQIFMIRGNHEDATINQIYGFREECCRRFPEADAENIWIEFNRVFEWLPCGARIQGSILCVHGGIGGSLNGPEEINAIERPLVVAQVPQNDLEQKITDLLWSDPSDSDNIKGVSTNETRDPDGTGRIVKFGPDRVESFLAQNNLSMIIRAHECVMDGFERFAGGKLITLFSATDYCGHHKNAGALLFVRRDLTIVPKLIYPVEQKEGTGWNDRVSEQRPPTPPRPVPRARRESELDENGELQPQQVLPYQ